MKGLINMENYINKFYDGEEMSLEEVYEAIELCDEWIKCHVHDYFICDDKSQAEELMYTVAFKLDLEERLEELI